MAEHHTARTEIAFVFDNLPDWQQLARAALEAGREVVVLDGSQDGLRAMAAALQGRSGIDAIHILSHGDTGKLQLGNGWFDSSTIAVNQALWSLIGSALSEEGDILLYGCRVAEDGAGANFIKALADATGADVAASRDMTGASVLGGNWSLEAVEGVVQAVALEMPSFENVLAAFSDAFDANIGSSTSFTSNLGGVSFTYTFTNGTTDDGGEFFWEDQYGAGNGPSVQLKSFTPDPAIELVTIARTDGADFVFSSIYINNTNAYGDVTVGAYRDGNLVGTAQVVSVSSPAATLVFNDLVADEVRITSTDFFQTNIDNFSGNTELPGTAPSLAATAAHPSFTENGSAVDLFNGITAATNDAGQVFNGMTLTVSNVSNGAAEIIAIGGTNVALNNGNSGGLAGGGNYAVSVAGNTATVTLTGLNRNDAQFAALVDSLSYRNTSDDPGSAARVVTITQIVDSGSNNNSVAPHIASTVLVTPVNDAPTLTATGNNPVFTENGATADLFSAVSVSAIEAGDNMTGLQLSVSDLADGNNERLVIDGTEIMLSHGTSGTTSGNAIGYSVSVAGNTAQVTLTSPGISSAVVQTVLDNLGYRNSSEAPTPGNRVVTLTQITDSGGTANGGANSTAVSIASTVIVSAVNDAPTLAGGPFAIAGTNEDTVSVATTVSTLLAGLSHADADGPNTGIAITASSGNGTWQYSTDAVTWTNVGAVSNNASLLLSANTQLRYVPDGGNGENASLTFRAWDQSSGTASTNGVRSTADTSSNGGATAFSSGTAQATLSVSDVNDAPMLTPSAPALNGLTDSNTNWVGQAVSSFAGANVSDVDTGAVKGIAITGLDAGNGTWQFSLDGGASWQDVGTVADATALLLRSNDRVRFVPDGVNGTNASITYRAWDQSGATSGQHGSKVDASSFGGASAFSSATDTASITVTAVNDAPLLTVSGGTSAFVEGDNVASTPVVIDAGITVADSDSPLLYGATVQITVNFQNAQDVLGFTNDGATMGDISASYDSATGIMTLTSAGGASAAQWQAALRAVTYGNTSEHPNTGNRTISFVINDGALDSSPAQRTVTVTAVNDAPTVTVPAGLSVDEDVAGSITGISFADADAGAGSVTVTLSVPSGTLSSTSGGGVTIGGTASALTLTGSISDINAFIAAGNVAFTTAPNSTADVTLTASISDNGLSGGAPATSSDTVQITVNAANDAPHITAPASISVTEDVAQALTGISFSDVDAGSGAVNVQFNVASGTLNATSGSGVTVLGSGSGTIALAGTIADINAFIAAGEVSFTTASNATANVVLSLTIDDGGNTGTGGNLTDSASVTLAVSAQNDAPVNSVPTTQSVLQDGVLVFNTAGSNALSISDVDAGGGTVQVTLTATQGSISLSGTAGLAFAVGSGSGDITMTFTGSINDINNALHGLSFNPNTGYTGAASLQIVTNDLGLSGNGGNRSDSDTILINVDLPNPSIVSVEGNSPDGTYKVGDTVHITVTYDQAVTVSGGVPSLLLETGAVDRNATYVDGSGTNVLRFAYTVQAGDQSGDLDYANVGALSLNGATIASVGLGAPSVNTLPLPGAADSLGANANLVIDGVAPAVTSVAVPADATYTLGQTLAFTVDFSEPVTVDTAGGAPRLAIALDAGGTVHATYTGGAGPTTSLTFAMTVALGQVDMTGIVISALQSNGATLLDAAGNSADLTLAGVAPTVGVRVNAPRPQEPEEPTPPTPPTPPVTPGIPDDDGVPNPLEDSVPGIPGPDGRTLDGDGNGDGIKDSEQAAVGSLAFLLTPTAQSNPGEAPPSFTTLVASSRDGKVASGTDNSRILSLTQLDAPQDVPAGMQTPLGLVSFTVALAQGKTGEDFSLYLDPALGINGYWKQDASGTWVNLASEPYGGKTVMEGGRIRLDFHIEDGGQFDADGKVDGIITDPGAPAHMPLSLVGWAPDVPHGAFWF